MGVNSRLNPFNGIERDGSWLSPHTEDVIWRIHSMELKEVVVYVNPVGGVTKYKESIQWN